MTKMVQEEIKTSAQPAIQSSRPAKKEKPNYEYMRDKDREIVKGIFHFYEVPGGTLRFSYRKYKGENVQNYELTDGQIASVPLGVAKHLNKEGKYPVHAYTVDKDGNSTMKVGTKVRRFAFQSLEFVDIDEFDMHDSKELVTIERASF